MAKKKFIRRDSCRFSKIGKNRKKLQKWRKPKGRDNKMKENRHGYPKSVRTGYKNSKANTTKINGLFPKVVRNVNDLEKTKKNEIVIVGRVGARKKLDIIKRVMELKLNVINIGGGKIDAAK